MHHPSVLVSLLAAAALCSSAAAQITYTEGADLNGQNLGSVALGDNTVTRALSASIINSSGLGLISGDAFDQFSFTVPAGMRVTVLDMTITNFAGTGSLAIFPGVQIVGVQFLFCTATSGTNTLPIPAPGNLAPGPYTFSVFTGLNAANNSIGNTRSFNYVLRIHAEADAGACCNRWTGDCAVMSPAACASVGLRYDGFNSTCSPATCKACPADFNNSGSVTVQDLFDYLVGWFAKCP